jgi:hypothetical protein
MEKMNSRQSPILGEADNIKKSTRIQDASLVVLHLKVPKSNDTRTIKIETAVDGSPQKTRAPSFRVNQTEKTTILWDAKKSSIESNRQKDQSQSKCFLLRSGNAE